MVINGNFWQGSPSIYRSVVILRIKSAKVDTNLDDRATSLGYASYEEMKKKYDALYTIIRKNDRRLKVGV